MSTNDQAFVVAPLPEVEEITAGDALEELLESERFVEYAWAVLAA
ncbi:hypothetical protein [Pseudomonas sp. 8Z]|nr:hypothetical protein [Pseudomonas sp. 8Z]